MQTTIVMQEGRIDMFHSSGTVENFSGPDAVKRFMARFKKVSKALELTKGINETVARAEMGKGLTKLKASLKPLKNVKK